VHDNQALFDAVQLKSSPADSLDDRVRRQDLATSVVALGEGIPFFLAGDDLLRSKSADKNSYNSGDWFNKLDFTYQADNWGVGLPVQSDNGGDWAIEQPLLADTTIRPGHEQIIEAHDRMGSFAEIQQNLHFLNTGPNQVPGLIVMTLDCTQNCDYRHVVVVFNATKQKQDFQDDALSNKHLMLHPVLADSSDPVVRNSAYNSNGTISVPALTTAVFVSGR
jgi:pullulanase